MPMFTVDESCTRCGLCAKLCVTQIIRLGADGLPGVAGEKEKSCIRCGQCVSFCPVSACHLDFQPEKERVAVDAALMPKAEAAQTLLRSRRSVRRYRPEPLSEGLIAEIMETVRYAPSASNSQPVRWKLTKDREKTLEIGALVADFMRQDTVTGRYAGVAAVWDKGIDIIFRGAPQLAIAIVDKDYVFPEDAAIALTYFELAAHGYGVGCCWAGFFTIAARKYPPLQKFLGLTENDHVVGGQMFGTPAIGASRLLPPRKKIDLSWL